MSFSAIGSFVKPVAHHFYQLFLLNFARLHGVIACWFTLWRLPVTASRCSVVSESATYVKSGTLQEVVRSGVFIGAQRELWICRFESSAFCIAGLGS